MLDVVGSWQVNMFDPVLHICLSLHLFYLQDIAPEMWADYSGETTAEAAEGRVRNRLLEHIADRHQELAAAEAEAEVAGAAPAAN